MEVCVFVDLCGCVFCLLQVVGEGGNLYIFINFLCVWIELGELFDVWVWVECNLIDIWDVVMLGMYVLCYFDDYSWMMFFVDVCLINMFEIVCVMELVFECQGNYWVFEQGVVFFIDICDCECVVVVCGVLLGEGYLLWFLGWYYVVVSRV